MSHSACGILPAHRRHLVDVGERIAFAADQERRTGDAAQVLGRPRRVDGVVVDDLAQQFLPEARVLASVVAVGERRRQGGQIPLDGIGVDRADRFERPVVDAVVGPDDGDRAHGLRAAQRLVEGDDPAVADPGEVHRPEVEVREQCRQVVAHLLERRPPGRVRRPPVTAMVDGDDVVGFGERRRQRGPASDVIVGRRAPAVQQDDRRPVTRSVSS